jgi:hypothetical protein
MNIIRCFWSDHVQYYLTSNANTDYVVLLKLMNLQDNKLITDDTVPPTFTCIQTISHLQAVMSSFFLTVVLTSILKQYTCLTIPINQNYGMKMWQ